MLNGTHSSLAYLGYLAGHETVSDTVDDPAFAAFCRHLWTAEIIPSIAPPPGEDLAAYADALLAALPQPRDPPPHLADRHGRLTEAPPAHPRHHRRQPRRGPPLPGLTLAVAAWMHYVAGMDESGRPIDVRDPLAERLKTLSDAAPDAAARVDALLGVTEVFPRALAADRGFRDDLVAALEALASERRPRRRRPLRRLMHAAANALY